jgi:hypothetical protein
MGSPLETLTCADFTSETCFCNYGNARTESTDVNLCKHLVLPKVHCQGCTLRAVHPWQGCTARVVAVSDRVFYMQCRGSHVRMMSNCDVISVGP